MKHHNDPPSLLAWLLSMQSSLMFNHEFQTFSEGFQFRFDRRMKTTLTKLY